MTIEKVFPTRVTLSANPSLVAGNALNITPTFTPSDTTDRQLVWTTNNEEIATVSSAGDTGLLVGKFSGTVIITATSVMDATIVETITIDILPAPLFSPAQWAAFLQFVRKGIGHFSLNFLNGLLGFLTFYVYVDPKKYKHLWVSIGVGIPLSMFHEALQFLAPGRTPTWLDAFYNTSGYLTAQLFMVVCVLLIDWRLNRHALSRHKK
jgi:VanZ family protein